MEAAFVYTTSYISSHVVAKEIDINNTQTYIDRQICQKSRVRINLLLELGFKNFFSFKEGATIDFRLDSNCPSYISNGNAFTHVLGIKGSNAAGKTNILRALTFTFHFASSSFQLPPDGSTKIESFFSNGKPSEFYIEFLVKNVLFRYELSVTSNEVIHESLTRKVNREVVLFERKRQKIVYRTNEFKDLDNLIVRKNASVISIANQYEIKAIKQIHNFFDSNVSNVTYSGLVEKQRSIAAATKYFIDNPEAFDFVKTFINKIDTGIVDITLEKQALDSDNGKVTYYPLFVHDHNDSRIALHHELESSGTKSLFRNLSSHWFALESGSVNIVDEIDANLHSMIIPELINLYTNPATNKKNAQLIFTTHNTEILDVLGRYRTYLVNKENNSSFSYRLDEVPGDILRNDRSISTPYLDGKIGGIPKLW